MRKLRHVEIPDCHDRIGVMLDEGVEKIRMADTSMLEAAMAALEDIKVLSDNHWVAYYWMKDELMERSSKS